MLSGKTSFALLTLIAATGGCLQKKNGTTTVASTTPPSTMAFDLAVPECRNLGSDSWTVAFARDVALRACYEAGKFRQGRCGNHQAACEAGVTFTRTGARVTLNGEASTQTSSNRSSATDGSSTSAGENTRSASVTLGITFPTGTTSTNCVDPSDHPNWDVFLSLADETQKSSCENANAGNEGSAQLAVNLQIALPNCSGGPVAKANWATTFARHLLEVACGAKGSRYGSQCSTQAGAVCESNVTYDLANPSFTLGVTHSVSGTSGNSSATAEETTSGSTSGSNSQSTSLSLGVKFQLSPDRTVSCSNPFGHASQATMVERAKGAWDRYCGTAQQ